MDSTVDLRITSAESDGRYALIEISILAKFPGAPAHFHQQMTERFVVIEGEIEVTLNGDTRTLGPGDSGAASPGTVHSFRNSSEARARLLLIATPGGHELFFAELMEWMEREPGWPPADYSALVEFGKKRDTYYL